MMTTPLWCLTGFAVWAVALVLTLATVRVLGVLTGQQAANSFPSGTPHGGDRYWRLNRAHMNTVENLPIFGALVLVAYLVPIDNAYVSGAAITVLVARIAQSCIHIASNHNMAVNLRFTAYLTQLGAFLLIAEQIATHG
jgi:uncharacterized MAPEG superfamily protein